MNEMFFSDKRPFFHSATLLQLEPIDLNVYTDFAVSQFKAAEKCIEPEAVTWAYQTYNGVTMYVHKLLHDCYAETKAGETCDIAAMKNASEQLILQNSSLNYSTILMPIPPMWYEMRILRSAVTLAVLLMRPLWLKVVFFLIFRLVFMRLNIIFANGGAVHLNGGAV